MVLAKVLKGKCLFYGCLAKKTSLWPLLINKFVVSVYWPAKRFLEKVGGRP
jgi:hypothetical protein